MFGRSLTCENDTVLTYNGKNYTVTLTLSKVQLQAFDIIDGTFSESKLKFYPVFPAFCFQL